jgi:hypothetical protein
LQNYYYYHHHRRRRRRRHRISHFSALAGNIHPSWDLITNRIRLGGLIYSLETFLRLNMCQELQIFAFVCMYLDAG